MAPPAGRWRRLRRFALAQARDLGILLRQFKGSLLGFVGVLMAGGWLIHRYYPDPTLDFGKAVYHVFLMIFFQCQLAFPDDGRLRVLFYVVPLLGLGLIVEGFVRFGVLVFNKQMRGEVWQKVVASTYSDHVIVCGLGHVGFRVVEQLLRQGEDVVVIGMESKFVERMKSREVPVLLGDAREETLLKEAGVERAKAVIVGTDDDLANLEIAMNARSLNGGVRIIVRMFDAEMARKVEHGLGIEMAFSTSALAAPHVALSALDRKVIHSFYVGDTLLTLAEASLDPSSPFVGKSLEELEQALDITVVVHRNGRSVTVHPSAMTKLEAGHCVTFLAGTDVLGRVEGQGLVRMETDT